MTDQADAMLNRCWWPWSHQWQKWQTVSTGKILAMTDALGLPIHEELGEVAPVIGSYETQRRECLRCGKSQIREIRT
jgi:hypothetical protein